MKITITGPRSVGKSTVSKIIARKLKLKYIDGDAEIDKAVKDLGGLYHAMNDGRVNEILERAVTLINEFFEKDDFIFDLAGGATTPGKDATKENHADLVKPREVNYGVVYSRPITDEEGCVYGRVPDSRH